MKGKGADPFNWGNANIDAEDLDPAAQQAAFDLMKLVKPSRKAARAARNISQTPAPRQDQAVRPVEQIPPDSYLGQTLKNIHRLRTRKHRMAKSGNDPSSSSSSSSSDSTKSEKDSESEPDEFPS